MSEILSPSRHLQRASNRLAAGLDRWFGTAWSAKSYDRCLLFALLYPISAIFLLWAATGSAGTASDALGLPPSVSLWQRAAAILTLAATAYAFWRGTRRDMGHSFGWLGLALICAIAAAVAFAFVSLKAFAVAGAIAIAFGGAIEAEFAGAYVVAGVVVGSAAVAAGLPDKVAFALAAAVVVADIVLEYIARNRGRQGAFLAAMTLAVFAACFAAARWLAAAPGWEQAAALILFLGLFTLAGAVVDFLALGVLRTLLRASRSSAPYGIVLAAVAISAVAVLLVAAAMAGALDLFAMLSAIGGGVSPISPAPLFDGIAAMPKSPAHWWVYALLSQAALPGLVVAILALWSLARGAPYLVALFFGYRVGER